MGELKRCPFCGGEATTDSADGANRAWVACLQCGARGPATSHGGGYFEAWNRRAEPTGEPSEELVARHLDRIGLEAQRLVSTASRLAHPASGDAVAVRISASEIRGRLNAIREALTRPTSPTAEEKEDG